MAHRKISWSDRMVINDELYRGMHERTRRHPTTLFADVHYCVEILRRFELADDAKDPAYVAPDYGDLCDQVTGFTRWWGHVDPEHLGPHVDTTPLARSLEPHLPVLNNTPPFLEDDLTAQMFVANIVCATLFSCAQGRDDAPLCQSVLRTLNQQVGLWPPVESLAQPLQFNPYGRPLPLMGYPSERVEALYHKYFYEPPRFREVNGVLLPAFELLNQLPSCYQHPNQREE